MATTEPISKTRAVSVTIGFALVILGIMYVIGQREAEFNARLARLEFDLTRISARVEYVNDRIGRVVADESSHLKTEMEAIEDEVRELKAMIDDEMSLHHHHGGGR